MVLCQRLTPEALLGAPGRSKVVPAPSGHLAFFTWTTPDHGSAAQTHTHPQLMLLNLDTGGQWPLSTETADEMHDICWMPVPNGQEGPDELVWLRPSADSPGVTEMVVAEASAGVGLSAGPLPPPARPYVAAVIQAPIRGLVLSWNATDETVTLAVTGLETDRRLGGLGGLRGLGTESAAVYDTWDAPLHAPRHSIFYGALVRKGKDKASSSKNNNYAPRWSLAGAGSLFNALQHAPRRLEAVAGMTSITDDALGSFDLGPQGIIFVGRYRAAPPTATLSASLADDDNDDNLTTMAAAAGISDSISSVFYLPLDSFTQEPVYKPTRVYLRDDIPPSDPAFSSAPSSSYSSTTNASLGFASHTRFSPNGTAWAFLWAPVHCPADVRMYLGDVQSGVAMDVGLYRHGGRRDRNDIRPSAFAFAPSGEAVILQAHDCGRRSLFWMDLWPGGQLRALLEDGRGRDGRDGRDRDGREGSLMDEAGSIHCSSSSFSSHHQRCSSVGSVSAFHVVPSPQKSGDDTQVVSLLVSASSFVESSLYYFVDVVVSDGNMLTALGPRLLSSSRDAVRYGLSYETQVSEMYVEGGGDGYCVQTWVVRPPADQRDATAAYPLALLVHDGPGDAWTDEWRTDMWNAAVWAERGFVVVMPNITGSLGFGLEHATRIYRNWGSYPLEDLTKCLSSLREVAGIDVDRAVLAGSGYGGYMVNWINGEPLGKKFCAAIAHNPIFSTELAGLTTATIRSAATTTAFGDSVWPWDNDDGLQRWNPARPDRLGGWRTHACPTLVVGEATSLRDGSPSVLGPSFPATPAHSLATFRALQFQGVPSRFLVLSGDNAEKRKQGRDGGSRQVWYDVAFAWLKQWVAEEEEPGRASAGEAAGVTEGILVDV